VAAIADRAFAKVVDTIANRVNRMGQSAITDRGYNPIRGKNVQTSASPSAILGIKPRLFYYNLHSQSQTALG
jgi:hypothetical protein